MSNDKKYFLYRQEVNLQTTLLLCRLQITTCSVSMLLYDW